MSGSREIDPDSPRKTVLSILLLVAIAMVTGWAMMNGSALVRKPPAANLVIAVKPGFLGASSKRMFLTASESDEAERRGLLPAHTRSILSTGGKLEYGGWRWDDQGVPSGPITVRVNLARQLVSVFEGPDEIGTAVIVYGANGKETPHGKLPILGKTSDYHSVTYDAPMPYSLWLRKDGVAVHGSSVTMGHATNGCIGVPVQFAAKLFAVAEKGDIVEVLDIPEVNS